MNASDDAWALLVVVVLALTFCSSGCSSGWSSAVDMDRPHVADDASLIAVGAAQVDVTPEEPIRLSGYGNRKEPTDLVKQRLKASALAFGENEPAVLIAVDLVGVSAEITERLASRLAERTDVRRENLAVTVTHTHTGPHVRGVLPNIFGEPIPPAHEAVIDRYTSRLEDLLLAVSLEALANRRPSRVEWSEGSVGFAANRRLVEDGKWTGFGVNPEGPVDHALPVMRVSDPDGAVQAVLVSYASHCTTLHGSDNFIHGDWAGSARLEIEAAYPDAVALVTAGAAGDQNPQPRETAEDVEEHGRTVAVEVERVFAESMRAITARPRGRIREIELPFAEDRDRSAWEAMASAGGRTGYHASVVLDRLDRGITPKKTMVYPVQTWTFGDDLAMVFLGGEVVVDYSLRLKREFDEDRLWVHAYANDVMCYIATDRLMDEGGYEVDGSMSSYDMPSRLDYGAEDLIVNTVRDLLPKTFGGER